MTYKTRRDGRKYIYCKGCKVREFDITKTHHKECGKRYAQNPIRRKHSASYVEEQMTRI